MLIQHIARVSLALLVSCAFGSGAAEACAVGFGLSRRFIPCRPLFELLQIYDLPHDRFHHSAGRQGVANATLRRFSRTIALNSVVILENSFVAWSKLQESYFALRKRHIFVLYHDAVQQR
jgi:hypothetical protein